MKPQLCLGTAQLGLAYGITNASGQVLEDVAASLLLRADRAGVRWLDTAQAYGNAEEVLGRQLPSAHRFRLISKLPAQSQRVFSAQDVEAWEQAFLDSCQHLGISQLNSFLLHAPSDLTKVGGQHLEDWLLSLRERGLVQRLGVSIYSAKDLESVNPELLDLVQLPLSLFDQRLLEDGTLARLRRGGTVIHARSLYLQGLLLTSAAQWPNWVNQEVRAHQQALEGLAKQRGCRLIDLALAFAREQTDLEAVVLGVCSDLELSELLQAWKGASPWQEYEWRTWALKDPGILDPRLWPR